MARILGREFPTSGDAGPPNVLSIGTVVAGTTAAASITGIAPAQTLNLTLPKGDPGDAGTVTITNLTTALATAAAAADPIVDTDSLPLVPVATGDTQPPATRLTLDRLKTWILTGISNAWADISGKPAFGTASLAATTDFATAAQGSLADTALQNESDPVFAAWLSATPPAMLGDIPSPLTAGTDYQIPLTAGTDYQIPLPNLNSDGFITAMAGGGTTNNFLQWTTSAVPAGAWTTGNADASVPIAASDFYGGGSNLTGITASQVGAQAPLTAGTDYQAPLTAGTDYLTPTGDGSGLTGLVAQSLTDGGVAFIQWGTRHNQIGWDMGGQDILGSSVFIDGYILGSDGLVCIDPTSRGGGTHSTTAKFYGDGSGLNFADTTNLVSALSGQYQAPLTAGTDYLTPTGDGDALQFSALGNMMNTIWRSVNPICSASDYTNGQAGIIKCSGGVADALEIAVPGTDYQTPLIAGTDYLTPTGEIGSTTVGNFSVATGMGGTGSQNIATDMNVWADGYGTITAEAFAGDLMHALPAPVSTDVGAYGQMRFTDDYIYRCFGSGDWRRADVTYATYS